MTRSVEILLIAFLGNKLLLLAISVLGAPAPLGQNEMTPRDLTFQNAGIAIIPQ